MSSCCVSGCKNRYSPCGRLRFYRVPTGSRPFQANRRRLWLQAIERANGSIEDLKDHARICGAHFISGEASMDHDMPDFVPSVFPCTTQSQTPKTKVIRVYDRRKSRHLTAAAETEKRTAPPGVDSPADLQPSVPMETESELPKETQTPSTPSVPTEGETLMIVAETKTIQPQTTSSESKTSPSIKLPAGLPKLDKMSPIVLLKRLVASGGGFHCELCNEIFSSTSQLAKHTQLHEETVAFICETCGEGFPSETALIKHCCVHTEELSFPCNMCDRSFSTNHHLRRHKLLHVKDAFRCLTCGSRFCRRHNYKLILQWAEAKPESNEDSSITEPQNSDSDSIEENGRPDEPKPTQVTEMTDNARSSRTVAPLLTYSAASVAPTPPIPELILKERKSRPSASHSRILSEFPVPVLPKPSPTPHPPSPILRLSRKPGTSFQLKSPVPDYPATFVQHHLPQWPELPSSLRMFSPQYLTSAFLEVKRNYKYILSKPTRVKIENIVKEEPGEPLKVSPNKQRVKQEKKHRVAYDLEIVL